MYHCYRRNKGILDRQYVTQSVVFRKDMTYQRVLEKCVSVVFPDDAHKYGQDQHTGRLTPRNEVNAQMSGMRREGLRGRERDE